MQSIVQVALLCALTSFVIVTSSPSSRTPQACSISEHEEMPCVCCKKDCWYTIAAAATHELGHIPGEAGEREALATLRLIRTCMVNECGSVCIPRVPF
ncbi:unnamed protein product [Nippostrongylus brasiliensis]|uniref:Secreted protein n=1 Tax=Nippostrongylus brasiliensis TaxID=27835 RepID=A0A0N4XX27_NIPBR|nr:hypothetical protein Q1695_002687 [Nippostrongylus brasiliensis]VDL71086.1 unnamed protein product [Nippostrongylus brasiliensis]